MRHLRQSDIDLKLRRPHLTRWKQELAAAVAHPGTPPEHREYAARRLRGLGRPRIYSEDDPAPLGAIRIEAPTEAPVASQVVLNSFDTTSLMQTQRSTLLAWAAQQGLEIEPTATKAVIVQAIQENKP